MGCVTIWANNVCRATIDRFLAALLTVVIASDVFDLIIVAVSAPDDPRSP
jgi:hypothetical protein